MVERLEIEFANIVEEYIKSTDNPSRLKSKNTKLGNLYAKEIKKIKRARTISTIDTHAQKALKYAYEISNTLPRVTLIQKDKYITQQIEFTLKAFNESNDTQLLEKKVNFLKNLMKKPISEIKVQNIFIGNIEKHTANRIKQIMYNETLAHINKGEKVKIILDNKNITINNKNGNFITATHRTYWHINDMLKLENNTKINEQNINSPIGITLTNTTKGIKVMTSKQKVEHNKIHVVNNNYHL